MRVVHVSDLHAGVAAEGDQAEIVAAVVSDVAAQHTTRSVDLVVFSGDLAFDGRPDSLSRGRTMLLEQLRGHLPNCPIFVVPGNHDVNRDGINKIMEAGLERTLVDRDAVAELLQNQDDLGAALSRLEPWFEFEENWDVGATETFRSSLARVYQLKTDAADVGIACLNTAWRAQGGDVDRGKLLLGDGTVREALAEISGLEIRIVVFHHPLTWLAEFDATQVREQLEAAGVFVLTGHEHSADPVTEISTRGAALYSRAGCLYETHEYSNSYTILDLDPSALTAVASVRRWWPIRREFDMATDLTSGGAVELPWPRRSSALPARRAAISDVLAPIVEVAKTHSVLIEPADQRDHPTIDDLLVRPRFCPVPHEAVTRDSSGPLEPPSDIDPTEALKENRVVILSGPPFSGVTGALLWVLDHHFRAVGTHLPAYVQADPRMSIGRLNDAVELALARSGEPVDSNAPVLLAVDDANPTDSRSLARLLRFLRDRPHVKLLIGTHGDAHATVANALHEHGISHQRVFLAPFGRKQLRQLVAHVLGAHSGDVVDRVLHVVDAQRLPRNPLNIAALVFVLAREPEATTINESGLLDSYVRVLLENPTGVDPEGLSMDARRREHLLQRLAEHLVRNNVPRLSREAAERFVLDYFDAVGWRAGSAGHLLDSLIRRRVLVEDDFGIGFRYRALLDFFAAKCVGQDPEFNAHVLAEPIRNAAIIRHAAGLRRDDADLLRFAAKVTESALERGPEGVTVAQFDLIRDEHGWSRVADLSRVRALLEPPPPAPTEEELDRIYDDLAPDTSHEADDLVSADDDPTPFERIENSARLLAAVLQNSELVADVDLKAEVLETVISGWSIGTVVLAVQEDQIGVLREIFETLIDEKDASRKRSLAEHISRVVVVTIMTVALYLEAGSRHLQGVLERVLDDETFMAETAHALFATMLFAMLELSGWPARVVALYRNHGKHPIVREVIRYWAIAQYQKQVLQRRDESVLEELIVDVVTPDGYGGLSVPQRAAQKGEIVENLRRSRLQQRLADGNPALDESD